jgi:epoxide hydrolase-like predicted phosphatase
MLDSGVRFADNHCGAEAPRDRSPRLAREYDLGRDRDPPSRAIARFERECDIEPGFINRVVVSAGRDGAWARLECGELSLEDFFEAFERDCAEAGRRLSARALMERIAEAAQPRPRMLEAVRRIRSGGLRAAALTNNWVGDEMATDALKPLFDAFVESSVVGLRKPDPRIYRHACDAIGVAPSEAIFLDDIGRNLKAARELGMSTIKVDDPDDALRELEVLLGLPLLDGPVSPRG